MSGRGPWQQVAKRIRVPLGFLFALLFLFLARPTGRSLAFSLLLVIPGLWLRAYAAGYVRKNAELTVTGPYAWTRNPLYLGSMMMAFGFAGGARSVALALILLVLFAGIYGPVIRGEEGYLREHFPAFAEYAARVPRLLPWRAPLRSPKGSRGSFSLALYRKNHEYNASMGAVALYSLLLARIVFLHGR